MLLVMKASDAICSHRPLCFFRLLLRTVFSVTRTVTCSAGALLFGGPASLCWFTCLLLFLLYCITMPFDNSVVLAVCSSASNAMYDDSVTIIGVCVATTLSFSLSRFLLSASIVVADRPRGVTVNIDASTAVGPWFTMSPCLEFFLWETTRMFIACGSRGQDTVRKALSVGQQIR